MAKAAKPAEKAKPDEEVAEVAPPKKGKKKLIIIIAAVLLLLGGGAAAFFLLKPAQSPDELAALGGAKPEAIHIEEVKIDAPAKFVDLGTFTANLLREDGDRYLQVKISLKITKPELEAKIKERNPEILHRVNMLLQSKRPSDLSSYAGKELLAQQIKAQAEYVLGLRKSAPVISEEGDMEPDASAQLPIRSDIAEVLFTSFIIQ